MLEGVFFCALVPELRSLLKGLAVREVGVVIRDGLTLLFPRGSLFLSARPDRPGVWWSNEAHEMAEPESPAWADHLKGAEVTAVRQQGADRVIVLELESADPYSTGRVRLVFEATGRNANLILVRDADDRVLAVTRRVDGQRSRYRTLVPGSTYRPPPPSGLPPGEWCKGEGGVSLPDRPRESDIYARLEGVGPCTAGAILREAESSGRKPIEVICSLEDRLLSGDFRPWSGPDGPLPVPLGPGEPLDDLLAPGEDRAGRTVRRGALEDYLRSIRREMSSLRRRLENLEEARSEMPTPQEYRHWGELLLANVKRVEKGSGSVMLDDWEGGRTRIPLSRSRDAVSNAQRYFRKARRCAREKKSLQTSRRKASRRLEELKGMAAKAPELDRRELERRLAARRRAKGGEGASAPPEYRLSGGWRCVVGRSARENDRVTFGLGRRGDIWLHARGLAGAHVLIKRAGRGDNPSARALMQAASIAANHSRGSGSSIVPVDWTEVQRVRRMKGGGPGQVTYTGEKTLYPDLSDPGTRRFLERIGDR